MRICCICCRDGINTAPCRNPSCRCHWYEDKTLYGEGTEDYAKREEHVVIVDKISDP